MIDLCAWNEFSQGHWRRAFDAYVAVNRSHWVGPPFEVVHKMLEQAGRYEFSVPSMGTWTSKFRLVEKEGRICVEFVLNEELSGRMRERLEQMREEFAQRVQQGP